MTTKTLEVLGKHIELLEKDILKLYADKAELVLGLTHMTQRYENCNDIVTGYTFGRMKICEELYKHGLMLDAENNVIPLTPAAG